MALMESSISSTHQEGDDKSEPLIPGLPDDVAEHCLHYLPYPYPALVRSVSSSWNRALTDPNFVVYRETLSLQLPYVFVFAFHKSTARIQWQALDPRSGRWFVLPPMPCPKSVTPPGFACASSPRQGKLFVLGGMRSEKETSMDTALVYDTRTNQWSSLPPLLKARSFCFAGSVSDGRILAVGGMGPGVSQVMTDVECYDVAKGAWAPVAKMRAGLATYDSAVVGGKMYVTEGWRWPFELQPRGGVYDSERDTWQEMSLGMRDGWTGLSVVLKGKLFVISEYGDWPMKVYVPDHDAWRYVDGDRFPREEMQWPFAVSGEGGRVYVVSSGLNVAIGRVWEVGSKWEFCVEWAVVLAPKAFSDFSPCNCQVLYA